MQHSPFLRNEMLWGSPAQQRLWRCHVAVFGIGGVGGFAAEALARAGVGHLTLVDHDVIGSTNINRQMAALHSTIGQGKAEVMAARVRDISPECQARVRVQRFCKETHEAYAQEDFDYVIDAIDLVTDKLLLIQTALSRGWPIVSALGTGNKLDPSLLRISDLADTRQCPLARVMRKELRKRGVMHLDVLWSPEPARIPQPLDDPPPGRRSVPASAPWVPGSAGLMMAGHVVRKLAQI